MYCGNYFEQIVELSGSARVSLRDGNFSVADPHEVLHGNEFVTRLHHSTTERLYARGEPLRLAALIAMQETPSAEYFDLIFEALKTSPFGHERAEVELAALATDPLLDPRPQSMLESIYSAALYEGTLLRY